jgi:Uncharacterized protein family, UPF0114
MSVQRQNDSRAAAAAAAAAHLRFPLAAAAAICRPHRGAARLCRAGRKRVVASSGHLLEVTEQQIILAVLGLIDVVMISNLFVMVIVGGFETFVSHLKYVVIRMSRNGSVTSTRVC